MWIYIDETAEKASDSELLAVVRRALASKPGASDRSYLRAARRCFNTEGDLEFDDAAVVSASSGDVPGAGAYVMSWKWVGRGDIELSLDGGS